MGFEQMFCAFLMKIKKIKNKLKKILTFLK